MTATLTDHLADMTPLVKSICRSRLPEREVADVVQDALLGLWRHLTANELVGEPHSLAATIAHRRCADHWRHVYSHRVADWEVPDVPDTKPGAETVLTLSAQLADLPRAPD